MSVDREDAWGQAVQAIADGRHGDPYAVLGPHAREGGYVVRHFAPHASHVDVIDGHGETIAAMERVHPAGLYEAALESLPVSYRFAVQHYGEPYVSDDPYRFPSQLGELDLHLMGEGAHLDLHDKLGAHIIEVDGVRGVQFAVWAPNASRVSVVGSFNDWDGRRNPMRFHPANGVWDTFIPGLAAGDYYKFELLDANGHLLPLKADPFARRCEPPPGNASVVHDDHYPWQDGDWMARRHEALGLNQPMSTYEVHLGSWRRRAQQGNRWLSYRELADELVDYVIEMGFTSIELLPLTEHPFDGSWGYQPIGLFAPTWRFGPPEDFKYLVDRCHQNGISVIMDWVPAHFPRDAHGLGHFDGTALYEHEDPRKGAHADWGTLIFNYGRREVANYLIASALLWIEDYHIDGLRVDAVASMLYLDYSREDGEWLPNEEGGRENLEAVWFLRRLNEVVHQRGGITLAEESTSWPMVSRPVYDGGLGFTYKWNMGWMNDTLAYIGEDPVHRKYHHNKLTFSMVYAFTENFVLPISHDEVVHGKGSVLGRMPGDAWQQFANVRSYYTYMFTHPGKKLLFMGCEFAQGREWNHNQSLDWHQLELPVHAGVQALVKDLNALYRLTPALYEVDFAPEGFRWIECDDADTSVVSFVRYASDGTCVAVVVNFTPVPREEFRVGVPGARAWLEVLNSDAPQYGGGGVTNDSEIVSEAVGWNGFEQSVAVRLPPLGAIVLAPAQ